MIGAFALVLLVAFSVYQLTAHGVPTVGIASGKRLRFFAAPLALSTLVGDANLNPPCTLTRHDPRALNICLLARRAPLVLAFFVPRSTECEREVDALQALSTRFPASAVQFAAVAVNAGRGPARMAARSHHWTIPVAYDRDGALGAVYGVEVCPLVELAHRGGVVAERLLGEHWLSSSVLAARVRTLLEG